MSLHEPVLAPRDYDIASGSLWGILLQLRLVRQISVAVRVRVRVGSPIREIGE
jgi:hypothetical protein